MADKKVILEVEIIEGNAQSKLDSLNASLKSLDKTHKDYKPTLQLIAQAERDLAKAQQNRILVEKGLVSSSVKVDKSTKRTAKEMKQLSSDTGASTSATLELGRVFSDAPYGIRGMANNIQQLASNLFFMSKKTDEATGKTVGFKGAVGSLLGGLVGPAGLLVIFQGVIALFDWYSNRAKKVTESTEAMSEGFIGLEKELSALYLTQEKSNEKIVDYIALSKIKSDLDAKKIDNEERLKEISEDLNDLDEKRESAERLKISNQKAYNAESDKQSVRAEGYLKAVIKNTENLNEINSSQNELRKEEVDIIGGSLKELEAYRKNKEAITAAEKDSLKGLEKLKSEQIAIQKTLSKTSEDYIKYGKDIEETQKKINEITGKGDPRDKVDVLGLDSIDIGENKKKMKKVLDAVADAVGVDLKKDPLNIDTNIDLELSDEAKKIIADKIKGDLDNLMLDSKLEDAKDFIDKSKEILGAMTDFANAEFDRELTIEQNKTNALNTQLNNRLNNENLSKEQRASIQLEIAQNDEKLRVKQDAIERKKFKMNKAARIANALMDTASAAIGVMADSKGDFFARLANAIPTIAFGLAQVAAISRQKFQSSSSKTPISTASGAGGSGDARAEPSFNIVGRSSDNILLSAIQSQFDQPLRAYVVARDVTNQQQLDGVISTAAST